MDLNCCDPTSKPARAGTTGQAFHFDALSRTAFARDSVGSANADVSIGRDPIDRNLEEAQTYGADSRYVAHDQWTSYPATGFTFPSNRRITNAFDALYRRKSVGTRADHPSLPGSSSVRSVSRRSRSAMASSAR